MSPSLTDQMADSTPLRTYVPRGRCGLCAGFSYEAQSWEPLATHFIQTHSVKSTAALYANNTATDISMLRLVLQGRCEMCDFAFVAEDVRSLTEHCLQLHMGDTSAEENYGIRAATRDAVINGKIDESPDPQVQGEDVESPVVCAGCVMDSVDGEASVCSSFGRKGGGRGV